MWVRKKFIGHDYRWLKYCIFSLGIFHVGNVWVKGHYVGKLFVSLSPVFAQSINNYQCRFIAMSIFAMCTLGNFMEVVNSAKAKHKHDKQKFPNILYWIFHRKSQ